MTELSKWSLTVAIILCCQIRNRVLEPTDRVPTAKDFLVMSALRNADNVLPQHFEHGEFIDTALRVLLSPRCWAVAVSERYAGVGMLLNSRKR